MFKCTISGVTCKFSLLFPAVLLFLMLLDDHDTALYCYSAAFLHECAHGVALCVCRIKPHTLTLSFFGMRLDLPASHHMTLRQTVFVAAAGPFGNLCCALILHNAGASQCFVAAHTVLAVLNSLPVMPLDGGQIATALCERVCSWQVAVSLEKGLFWVTWTALVLLGFVLCKYSGGNFTLLAVALYIGSLRLFYKCD